MYNKPNCGLFLVKSRFCDVRRISCLLYCKRVIPQLEPLDIMTNETSPNYVSLIHLSHVQESMFVLEEMHCMLFSISMISKYKMISKNWWYCKYWGQWPLCVTKYTCSLHTIPNGTKYNFSDFKPENLPDLLAYIK